MSVGFVFFELSEAEERLLNKYIRQGMEYEAISPLFLMEQDAEGLTALSGFFTRDCWLGG